MRIPTALLVGAFACASALSPATALAAPSAVGGDRLSARGIVVSPDAPALPQTVASGWLVADMNTGEVLAAKDPHGRYAPASTLKVLTAETLIPRLDPAQIVKPTFDDVNVDGSRVGIVDTMNYTVKDLLTAMLVVSGNDAANTLATANGGVKKTVDEMNAEAQRLQAYDTTAVNANGLDNPRQLSSPYDLALIGRAAMHDVSFRQYVATKIYYMPAPRRATIYLSSHDKLLWNYKGAIGIKNGYTVKAQATFVGAATRGGHTLIVTLMHTAPRYWPEAAALLNWGFAAEKKGVDPVGQLVDPIDPSAHSSASPSTTDPEAITAPPRRVTEAGSSIPLVPSLIVAAGASVLGGGLFRTRRRRRPRKMALPPL